MSNTDNRRALAQWLEQAYLKVTPARGIEERLAHIPRHSYLSITCSPTDELDPTLDLLRTMAEIGHHIEDVDSTTLLIEVIRKTVSQ